MGGFFFARGIETNGGHRWEATKNEFGAITCVDAPEKKNKREEFKA